MQRCFLVVLAAAALAVFSASGVCAQATPAGRRAGELRVGVGYSNGSTDELSKRVGGFSVYGNYSLLPHFAIEADVHLLTFFTPQDYGQRSYLAGGRFFYRKRRYEPYVKFLGGLGQSIDQLGYVNVPGSPDTYGVFAGGGGLDVLGPGHIVFRAFDYEKQVWPAFSPRDLTPSVLTFGVAYRIR